MAALCRKNLCRKFESCPYKHVTGNCRICSQRLCSYWSECLYGHDTAKCLRAGVNLADDEEFEA